MAANTHTEPSSLPALLRSSATRYAGRAAILTGDRSLEYTALNAASDRVASALAERGIVRGDRVGLYCANSDAFVVAYFGILKAGATVVPLNLLLNPHEIAYILDDAGARALVYLDVFAEAVRGIRAEVPSLEFGVCIGANPVTDGDLMWAEAMSASEPPPEDETNPIEDIAAIIYTSGTTGKPKGAMLTHANLAANTSSCQRALQLEPGEDIVLTVLPMFHAFAATAAMLTPLFYGGTIAPLPRFEPHQVADTIEATKATLFMGVPSMFNTLLRLPEKATAQLQSLKHCISGGAAMPAEIMARFEKRYGKLIYEGDGPTECSPVTCCNPIDGERKIGSVGLPVPDVEMKIFDDDGQELPVGDIGEICVRGPNVMKGYWNRPDETRESFFDEWFRTGDLGNEDEDGYFFIVDRKKDMIIVNGMNVYPRVIEEILYQFGPIHEAAVVGEPHKLHGEIPVAFVALDDHQTVDAAAVRAHCREYLGRHEVPRRVIFLDALPKNAAGKIVKRELRKHGELERGIDSRADA